MEENKNINPDVNQDNETEGETSNTDTTTPQNKKYNKENIKKIINNTNYKEKGKEFTNKMLSSLQNTTTFQELNNLSNEKKFYGFIIIVLAIIVIIQGISNYGLIKANRTIIMPPVMTKEFWATDKKLSESYFEQIGFYIADRVLSVSPETVDSAYVSLLPFFDSNSTNLKNVRKKLREQAEFVKKENMYQVFYPLKMLPEYSSNKITIEGPIKKFIGSMLIQESDKAKITIYYETRAGRFMIKSLDFKYKDN